MSSQNTLNRLQRQLKQGRLNRREFLQLAGLLGITAVTTRCTPSETSTPTPSTVQLVYEDWETDWFPGMAQETLAQFHETHPNIRVFYKPDPDDLETSMIVQMKAGTAPDVLQGCCTFFPVWAQQGQLLDLRPYVAADLDQETLDDWNQAQYRSFFTPNGVQYGLPKYQGALAVFYNKDMFDEAGLAYPTTDWTMDDYLTMMKALTVRDGNGRTTRWGSILDVSWDRLQIYVNSWGGHYVDPQDASKCLMGAPEALAGFQWVYDRMWQDKVMATALDVEKVETRNAFLQKKTAMVEDGSWALKDILANADFRIGVAVFPKGPVRHATLATTDGFGIYANTPYPDQAWDLLQFLISKEYGLAMARANFLQPARKSLIQDWVGYIQADYPEQSKDVDLAAFADGQINEYAVTAEIFPNITAAANLASEAWNKIFTLNQQPVSSMATVCQQIEAAQKSS